MLKIFPIVTDIKNEEEIPALSVLTCYRVDVKNFGSKDNTIDVETDQIVKEAPWLNDHKGCGKTIQSHLTQDTIKIKVKKDGFLRFDFRAQDKRYKEECFPVWVDYESIRINGKEILSHPISVWHDLPYTYELTVRDGQEIILKIKQKYHKYTEAEFKDLLEKLYLSSDSQNLIFKYYRDNIGFLENTYHEKRYSWDYVKNNYLTQEPKTVSIQNITENMCGRLQIDVGHTKFESILIPSNTKKLYVVLAVIGEANVRYPTFGRISWCEYFNGYFFSVDDPTRFEKGFAPAFYFGTGEENYTDYLLEIIKKIALVHNIGYEDIIFISSSNGGFASLLLSDQLPGSKCIALCPQVDVMRLDNNAFCKRMHIEDRRQDYSHRLKAVKILKNCESHFFIFSNLLSLHDREQMEILYTAANKKLKLGLTQLSENVRCLLTEIPAIDPHLTQPGVDFVRFIESTMTNPIAPEQEILYDEFVDELKNFHAQQLSGKI